MFGLIHHANVNVNLMEEIIIQVIGEIMINIDVWNPATCNCKNEKYLASIIDDSVVRCNEIAESYNEKTNFNERKATCKTQNLYISVAFLLITIALLIAVSSYCYLIKYRAKQKHLLPFNFTNNKLKEIIY